MKKYNFTLIPGIQGTNNLYYSESDAEERCIGHLRGDFGDGMEFWTQWFPHAAADHNDKQFQDEFSSLVKTLRRDVLKNRYSMHKFFREHDGLLLDDLSVDTSPRGYMVMTENYDYYIRCQAQKGDYNFYIYAYTHDGMTEYEKLVQAEKYIENAEANTNSKHSSYAIGDVAIVEKATGQEGVASTQGDLVQVFYGADDGTDDKTISIDEFNQQFRVTGFVSYWE